MDFPVIHCVIDRWMAYACTSVATDGDKKKTFPIAAKLIGGEPSLPCPVLLLMSGPVLWGFRKTRQSSEKKPCTEDCNIWPCKTEN